MAFGLGGFRSEASEPRPAVPSRTPLPPTPCLSVEPRRTLALAVAKSDDLATFSLIMRTLKRAGLDDFGIAWSCALPPSLPDRDRVALRSALDETQGAWLAAWDGEDATPAEARLVALALILDDEPINAAPVELPHAAPIA